MWKRMAALLNDAIFPPDCCMIATLLIRGNPNLDATSAQDAGWGFSSLAPTKHRRPYL